jgi:catechol 2,3-dioxygenase-like lactoylglutathione lyase family enzyme
MAHIKRDEAADVAANVVAEGASALRPSIPILRMFDATQARQFYVDFLGFSVDWEHRKDAGYPLYMQVSREECVLHLSEHFGDATPGSGCFVPLAGVEAFYGEVAARNHRNLRLAAPEEMPWGRQLKVSDPFGNKLTFCEQRKG